MNFDFSETAGLGKGRQQLEANAIHTVKFMGCEARDVKGVQNPSEVFHVLDIKFEGENGVFTHTVWPPKDSDFEDTQGAFGPNPSNVKAMMALLKHLIDAVNPEVGKKIDKKEISLTAPTWDGLRKLVVEYTKDFVGTETKIKLIKNNKGAAAFPSFFMAYNREGKPYMRTNFIGNNVFFTDKELTKMKTQAEAKPTAVTDNALTFDASTDANELDDLEL